MSDLFRVTECFHRPSKVFTIHDYSRMAYIAGSFICLREVITPEVLPTFIKIQNKFTKMHALISYPNLISWLDENSRELSLRFNDASNTNLRLASEIMSKSDSEDEYEVNSYQGQMAIFVVISRDTDNEIIVIEVLTKKIMGRGYFAGEIATVDIKTAQPHEQLTVTTRDNRFIQLQLVSGKKQQTDYRLVVRREISLSPANTAFMHCCVGQEVIFANKDKITIDANGKQIQSMNSPSNIKGIKSISTGFILVTDINLRIYRRVDSYYEVSINLIVPDCQITNLHLSPQEDLIAFYDSKSSAIQYAMLNNAEQMQQKTVKLTLNRIGLQAENQIKLHSSPHSVFFSTLGPYINIYSPLNYHCYLSVKLSAQQKQSNQHNLSRAFSMVASSFQQSNDECGSSLALHPSQLVLAVALKNSIKIYQILYGELKVIKQIQLAHCKTIGFSESGMMMHALVGGKQGAKIYLYKTNEAYEIMQVISVSKKVESIFWSKYDCFIYAIHEKCYSSWGLTTLFKTKIDNSINFGFQIIGATIDHHNNLLVWSANELLRIQKDQVAEKIASDRPLSNVLAQNGYYVIVLENGEIFRSKDLNFKTGRGFKLTIEDSRIKVNSIKNNILACSISPNTTFFLEWGPEEVSTEIVAIERKKIIKYQNQYHNYEKAVLELQEKLSNTFQILRDDFHHKERELQASFTRELKDSEERYQLIKKQKNKVEQAMEVNIAVHERETISQVKELEKIYERKIAITMNKLLTSEEITYRNKLLAESNLKFLEERHGNDIEAVRKEYAIAMVTAVHEKDQHKQGLYAMKMEYETKLAELEQQNDHVLKQFQQTTENSIINLKKNVFQLEVKYSQAISQKYNLSVELQEQHETTAKCKNFYQDLKDKFNQAERRYDNLKHDYSTVQKLLGEKDRTIQCYEKRIEDLEKANEIFKYRIVQMKSQSDPQESEIIKLKDNMVELEEQYDKIAKKSFQSEQFLNAHKKQNAKLKQSLAHWQSKEKKTLKDYITILDRIRQTTKAPYQEVKRHLISILDQFDVNHNRQSNIEDKRPMSPLGELNRMREHLEICLEEAIGSSKKVEVQKNNQISKKNYENSELLKQINDLRHRVRNLETEGKDKDLKIQNLLRGEQLPTPALTKQQRRSTNYESATKNKTRESFFEKSLFKQPWNEKRLKTEQGSRRKKSSHSLARQHTNNLVIETRSDENEELKRIIEQKQTIIKQLINKIHRLS